MTEYKVNDIKSDVRLALDQNSTGGQLVELRDIDALMMESIIESKLLDAARIVESSAPTHLLGSGVKMENVDVDWNEYIVGAGSIKMPDDYMRLVIFKMGSWMRPVTSIISVADPLYALQKSRFAGVRGCPERPIVAMVPTEDDRTLEFYTSTSDEDSIELCQYLPMPKIVNEDGEDKILLCEKLRSSIVYYTAYLVAISVGEAELAATLQNTAKELMQ